MFVRHFSAGLLLALATTHAVATVAPAIDVEILDVGPAAAGELYQGTIRVTATYAALINGFELVSSAAWSTTLLDAPVEAFLQDQEFLDIPFETLAIDPSAEMLAFRCAVDDRVFTYPFDLSPEGFADAILEHPLKPGPSEGGKHELDSLPRPGPVLPEGVEVASAPQSEGSVGKAARWITVQGKLIYVRPDFQVIGADVVTVLVYHNNTLLGSGTTDSQGNYILTVYWNAVAKPNPDLRVAFRSQNTSVKVTNASDQVITWSSTPWLNFAGNTLNVGSLKPADTIGQEYLNLHTVLTRTWRLVLLDAGILVDPVKARRLKDAKNGSWYDASKDQLSIASDGMWAEVLHGHEYGHHLIANHGAGSGSGYCNGVCENPNTASCDHCTWCEEADIDAWNEGFPTWIAWTLVQKMPTLYGVNAIDTLAFESLALCWEDNLLNDPTKNEGAFVALLNDLTDTNNESDPMLGTTYKDRLSLPLSTIWDVMQLDQPLTPLQFMDGYVNRNFPDREKIWETAKNNGYELDALPPDASSFMIANGHTVNVPSPDNTIKWSWVEPFDDMSGVTGYSYLVSTGGPQLPDQSQDFGDVTTYTTGQLAPGTYWINLRAKDRIGRWSAQYSSIGPYIIVPPAPPDLGPTTPASWVHPVVPESAPLIFAIVPAPATLIGEGSTYWNLSFTNHGGLATSTAIQCDLLVDGQTLDLVSYPAIPNLTVGATRSSYNLGPMAVNGGRHTLGAQFDALEVMAETNEGDNAWARQWVWQPTALNWGMLEGHVAPPTRTGGWDALGVPAMGVNLDARRISVGFGFYGVAIHAREDADDYDLELHTPSTGAQSGFDSYLATSARVQGYLDAVLVYRPLLSTAHYDVGLVNWSGESNYLLESVVGNSLDFGTLAAVHWDLDHMLSLYAVIVPAEQLGAVSAEVRSDTQKASVLWFDKSFGSGGLGDASYANTTNSSGVARIDLVVDEPGQYFVAVYRDPRDGSDPADWTLEVGPTKPDVLTLAPNGWFAPLVPSPLPDGTPNLTRAPLQLFGDISTSWMNLAVGNTSAIPAPSLLSDLVLDGNTLASFDWGAQAGGAISTWNNAWEGTVSGGRHTLASRLDSGQALGEQDETNNSFAQQWVWEPIVLGPGAVTIRSTPPNRTGSWSELGSFENLWFNCDAVRAALAPSRDSRSGMWMAVAAMPGVFSDVDLQLHEASTGAQDGFDDVLSFSGWEVGNLDFVLVNGNRTLSRSFDIGLLEAGSSEDVWVQHVNSQLLSSAPNGAYGPFSMDLGQMLDLHEVWLSPGNYIVHLTALSGGVDWGMTLHRSDAAYQSKSMRVAGAMAWTEMAGEDEWLTVGIDAAGYYCLSVWKKGFADLGADAAYALEFQSGVTETPDAPVLRTVLSQAIPNPFNPRTSFELELATADEVRVSVFDAAGRRVRDLLQGNLPAGRHQLIWEGTDERGLRVASGVYFAQLETKSGVRQQRRLTLVK